MRDSCQWGESHVRKHLQWTAWMFAAAKMDRNTKINATSGGLWAEDCTCSFNHHALIILAEEQQRFPYFLDYKLHYFFVVWLGWHIYKITIIYTVIPLLWFSHWQPWKSTLCLCTSVCHSRTTENVISTLPVTSQDSNWNWNWCWAWR